MTSAIRVILVALALCTAGANANAAMLYVANNGVDSRNCGTKGNGPCRSISRALALAADGDTIEVGPGLYGDIDADGQFVSPGDEQAQLNQGCECIVHVNKSVTVVSRAGATQTLVHPGPPTAHSEYTGAGFAAIVRIDAPAVVLVRRTRVLPS